MSFDDNLIGYDPGKRYKSYGPAPRKIMVYRDLPRKLYGNARRNEPCPCGSGKKYKTCCYDIRVIPIPEKRSKSLPV